MGRKKKTFNDAEVEEIPEVEAPVKNKHKFVFTGVLLHNGKEYKKEEKVFDLSFLPVEKQKVYLERGLIKKL